MKKKIAMAALLLSASGFTAAHASTDTSLLTDSHQLLEEQKGTNVLLTQILSELQTLKAAQNTDMDCYSGEKRYTQGFTVTTQGNTTLRCDIRNGHAAWVDNTNVFAN